MTLAELRALCRLTLADTTGWPNATLDAWISAGIRLYSAHFPRHWRYELELVVPLAYYALPGGHELQAILSVEYPAGESPPRFCRQVPEGSAEFASGGDYYALRGVNTDASVAQVGQIVFARVPENGDECFIEYLAGHALPAAGSDTTVVTVPEAHIEAITSFVEFCALHELEADEASALDDTTIALSQLGQEARRAWIRYKEVMDRLLWLSPGLVTVGGPIVWGDIGL